MDEGSWDNDEKLMLPGQERSDHGKSQFSKKMSAARIAIALPGLLSYKRPKATSSGKDTEQHSQSEEGRELLGATSSPDVSPSILTGLSSFKSLTKSTSSGKAGDEQHSQSSREGHELLEATSSSDLPPSYQHSQTEEGHELQRMSLSDPSPSIPLSNQTTSKEEAGRNALNKRTWRSALFRNMYGKESIWHHMLYGPPEDKSHKDHPKSDLVCALGLIGVLVFVYVIVYQSQSTWPQIPQTYYTSDPLDNIRGGSSHTCGCILPPSLQSPQNPTEQTNLNICYQPSSRETVTILMYSNSTAEDIIHDVIVQEHSEWETPINVTLDIGWYVTQDAHELSVQNPAVFDFEYLTPFYPGGERQPKLYTFVENLRRSYFPNNFPGAYIQMDWIYDCNDCQTCSLKEVNSLSRRVVDESWVSCYYYGFDSQCATTNSYTAKCVLYSPESLPMQFAVQRFLEKFLYLPGISNVRGNFGDNLTFVNYTTALQPDVLYLSSSTATRSKIRLGFLEVRKDSGTWAILSSYFPTFDIECALLPKVTVCNGSSLCTLFSTAAGFDFSCTDFTSSSQCQPLRGNVTPDNAHLTSATNESQAFADIICPKNIKCSQEFPYLVTWNVSESGANDALNSFLASWILTEEWERHSGVCTKTYKNVIRHQPRDGDSNESETMFLESQCSNATVSQPSFCWLTGNYHNLADLPGNDTSWKKLPGNVFSSNDNLFSCYRMERQNRADRFVNNFGVMFGWFGTIVLVFYGLFSVWILWRDRTIRFFASRFASVRDRCRGSGSVSPVVEVPSNEDMPEVFVSRS